MFKKKKIQLFWWSEIFLLKKNKENYGDFLGKYLVEKISGKQIVFKHTKKIHYLDRSKVLVTIGSVLANVNSRCVVWGSGIISKSIHVKNANFLAVRGPQTRNYLLNLGYDVPEIYGDPALLLPNYYNPKVEKKYKIGVIPHYNDFKKINKWFKNDPNITVIDLLTNSIESTTNEILMCHKIVSSSLHGIILGHAYQIPAVWQKFSSKLFGDDIKFQDYFESVELKSYTPEIVKNELKFSELQILFNKYEKSILPSVKIVNKLKIDLMQVCPFKAS